MAPTRRAVLGSTAAAVALAGCVGGDDGTPTDGDGGSNATDGGDGGGGTATVQVSSHADLGDILVGADGMTLYMFDQDTRGEGASTCYDSCESAWPPLTVDGEPSAGDGVNAELTTFERDDGSMQVAADGWPLYYFASDEQAGDANGQGVNDVWWVLRPDGSVVRDGGGGGDGGGESTSTPSPTSSGGGGGGPY